MTIEEKAKMYDELNAVFKKEEEFDDMDENNIPEEDYFKGE